MNYYTSGRVGSWLPTIKNTLRFDDYFTFHLFWASGPFFFLRHYDSTRGITGLGLELLFFCSLFFHDIMSGALAALS